MVAKVPVNVIAVEVIPLQIAWLTGIMADGVGLTVIKKVDGLPVQPFAAGVTVMEPLIGTFVLFVAINDGMLPDPFAARPIVVLSFIQVKVVPKTGPVGESNVVVSPLQNSLFMRLLIVGVGFTVTATFSVWGHPFALRTYT